MALDFLQAKAATLGEEEASILGDFIAKLRHAGYDSAKLVAAEKADGASAFLRRVFLNICTRAPTVVQAVADFLEYAEKLAAFEQKAKKRCANADPQG